MDLSLGNQKQTATGQSTAKAEFVALNPAAREVSWIHQLWEDMTMETAEPISIYEDNQSAITMCTNPINHQATKHIAVKLGYIKNQLMLYSK